ncbi:tetratricopeptide repeat protein 1-like [Lingula anatina]|uniref:Tetratricopeptide repeat protein 1-like n=1 Tax=Lingula anatina TaxID=7574 RepID=A0A1S3JM41_LINAN|nr:tetratricopeptide repeat protein 1-like [Lingula anatina]|eukprot:XP_013410979.1 tetratricopeptide repeat protein 1-like [Lingula anatina]
MASVDPNDLAGDLTQNLENSLKEEKARNESDSDKKSFIKDDNCGINKKDYHENENSQHQKCGTDVPVDEVEAGESDSDVDKCTKPDENDIVVDEEYMKKLEEKMSEEEKQVRKDEAQALKANGNSHFKASEFQLAICSYTQALQTCPLCFQKERAIMYSNRAACRLHLVSF